MLAEAILQLLVGLLWTCLSRDWMKKEGDVICLCHDAVSLKLQLTDLVRPALCALFVCGA